MNGKLVKLAAIATVSTIIASAAIAQQRRPAPDGQGPQREGKEDGERRGPGKRPSPDEAFDRADANNDGTLTREEFKEWFTHRPPPPPPRDREGDDRPPPPPRD
jgi:hypothetical protein